MEIVIAGLMYLGIIFAPEGDQPTADQGGVDDSSIVIDDAMDE